MDTDAYTRVTDRLQAVTGYHPANDRADWRCPAHDDGTASLSVNRGDKGVILNCHAGCETTDICKALDITMGELFDREPERQNGAAERPRVVAEYTYTDADGNPLFVVKRWEPGFDGERKTFRQYSPDGRSGRQGAPTVLYRLPKILDAVRDGRTIFVVEGEKDVEALERAGEVATTAPAGAGKWKAEHTAALTGAAEVVIVRDKDGPGIKHAADVEAALTSKVDRILVVDPAAGKDAAEHLGAGHTVDEFKVIGELGGHDESLDPIDLAPFLDGTITQPMPSQLTRDDGASLFYNGCVNGIHGDSGAGKGWVICHLIVQNAAVGRRTLLLDLEDTAESITARLRQLGLDDYSILTWLVYIRPQVPLRDEAAVKHLQTLVTEFNIGAVVVDSLGEAFSLEGVNEDKDVEVGPWYRAFTRPLADAGPAVVIVDHSTKAADNPLHPSGSKRKRAAITGASYLAEALKPFVKGEGGRLLLTCAKDRHGNYRRGEAVASLVMDSTDDSVTLRLYAPSVVTADVAAPTILAARAAVKAARDAGRPVARDELVGLMRVKAATDTKRGGIDYATAEGALTEERGQRGARIFTYQHDLEETP